MTTTALARRGARGYTDAGPRVAMAAHTMGKMLYMYMNGEGYCMCGHTLQERKRDCLEILRGGTGWEVQSLQSIVLTI